MLVVAYITTNLTVCESNYERNIVPCSSTSYQLDTRVTKL